MMEEQKKEGEFWWVMEELTVGQLNGVNLGEGGTSR